MKIDIFGIGNYTEVIIELIVDCGHEVRGLYHYSKEKVGDKVMGYEVLGDYDFFFKNINEANVVVGIGDNQTRVNEMEKLNERGYRIPSLMHPKAYISKSASIGKGTYVHANSFIWTKSKIGNYSIISPNAMVAHHSTIGNGALISANSMIGSYVTVGDLTLVGINAGIDSKKINIGDNVLIGGQSFVKDDIPSNKTCVGIPAKIIKSNNIKK